MLQLDETKSTLQRSEDLSTLILPPGFPMTFYQICLLLAMNQTERYKPHQDTLSELNYIHN